MPLKIRTDTYDETAEGETIEIEFTATDLDDAAIPGASIVSMTMSLYEKTTGAIINSRNAVNVLNLNGGTVNSSGGVTMRLDPDDMVLVDRTREREIHVALFTWTHLVSGVTQTHRHEISFPVVRTPNAA